MVEISLTRPPRTLPANPGADRRRFMLAALRASAYQGEIAEDVGTRVALATDNSIYELRPDAVLFPRTGDDLNLIVTAAAAHAVPLVARGGGTGTNGQALGMAVVVDTSKHLTRILDLDLGGRQVTVEPGVVLDQLNAFLKPHGLFFPAMVSTASRATLGGMVATDASGKGSRHYGKTSRYLAALDVVLATGDDWRVTPMSQADAAALAQRADAIGHIHALVPAIASKRLLIESTFPKLNRALTGYNLADVLRPDGNVFLGALLAGSEGTLALTKRLTLDLLPIPKYRSLVAIAYDSFDAALEHVGALVSADPLAVEILDDKILARAAEGPEWPELQAMLGQVLTSQTRGLNLIEIVADSPAALQGGTARVMRLLKGDGGAFRWTVIADPGAIAKLWQLRQRGVGLLGSGGAGRNGTAFVEDCAVPPEHLPAFIREFRALLDAHHLDYGMYGHADVGCLHVRPLLNMRRPADRAKIRPISDAAFSLARRYGGLLWGEHGKGFRGEYVPATFGPELTLLLQSVKAAFDPRNLLNPGKIAHPAGAPLERIDSIPMRGTADETIASTGGFGKAVDCNGNGECFSWNAATPMCPSYKGTSDRVQSPKGRAALLREWLRLEHADPEPSFARAELEERLHASLRTCLSCKACTNECPVRVDIPSMKSRFLETYFRTRPRPVRDILLSHLETILATGRAFPVLSNVVLAQPWITKLLARFVGLSDLPLFVPARRRPTSGQERSVILLRDSFTASFEGRVIEKTVKLLEGLGFSVHLTPVRRNGKALEVLGFRRRFRHLARRETAYFAKLARTGLPIVGIEPATNLMHGNEYVEFGAGSYRVIPLEKFLRGALKTRVPSAPLAATRTYKLFLHCTEKTADPRVADDWGAVFAAVGQTVTVAQTGCCGMSGIFGHETEHRDLSLRIFDLSWREELAAAPHPLATGFSCRCQAKRFTGCRPEHPVEGLYSLLHPADWGAVLPQHSLRDRPL